MQDSKLEELISVLDARERREILAFLGQDRKATDTGLSRLFLQVSEGKAGVRISRKGYEATELIRLIERYICYREVDRDETNRQLLFAGVLYDRPAPKVFRHLIRRTEAHPYRNADYHRHAFRAKELLNAHNSVSSTRNELPDYNTLQLHLDAYYFSRKLQLMCEMQNLKNILQGEVRISLESEVIAIAEEEPFRSLPAVHVYSLILHTLRDPDDESRFYALQDFLREHGSAFPPRELNEIYQYLKNYGVRRINSGQPEWLSVLFNLYKEILADERLLRMGHFSPWEFKNIVTISLRLGEKEWCASFIRDYAMWLDPAQRANAVRYNTAYLHFMSGDLRGAIRLLRDVEFTDIFYKLDARVILLKCYYELEQLDQFFYHASAFRLFLLRDKQISDYQKKINRNLLRFLERLARYQFSPTKLRKLRDDIVQEKFVADLRWLLERVDKVIDDR